MKFPKIYIIHLEELEERRKTLEIMLNKQKIRHEWVVQNKRDSHIKIFSDYYYINNKDYVLKNRIANYEIFPRKLNMAEISIGINHLKVLKKIANGKDEYAIIFEDDIIFKENFKKNIRKLLKNKWDIIYLERRDMTQNPNNNKNLSLINKYPIETWFCSSYLIRKETAKRIIKEIPKFNLPIDEEIKYVIMKNKINVAWVIPDMCKQNKKYRSSIQNIKLKRKIMNFFKKNKIIHSLYRKIKSKILRFYV